MFRNRSVSASHFAMVPRGDVPRARFDVEFMHKTTFNADLLVPVFCEEVLPGDSFNVGMTAFARLSTPIFPLMDNLHLDSFFFFVPNRLVWSNWVRFQGERDGPDDSIDYVVPKMTCPPGGHEVGSLYDYLGLPTVGQVAPGETYEHSALPIRAYMLILNEWFRDQNIQNSIIFSKGDGPDSPSAFQLYPRTKRADYFTTALPWPQKGEAVTFPFLQEAPVVTKAVPHITTGGGLPMYFRSFNGAMPAANNLGLSSIDTQGGGRALHTTNVAPSFAGGEQVTPTNLYANLNEAAAVTINQLRTAFQVQRLLERDARGGTRYVELLQSHFGVRSPDARLQRPEYLGGGSTPMQLTPIAQTSATTVSGTDTPLGNLAAIGTVVGRHGFSGSFVEHGYVLGIVNVRSDVTYQQGLRRHWSRSTRYDFYMPAFAHLGEQAVLSRELYCTGEDEDSDVFGYQERWAEYRYVPSQVTGLFRSTTSGTLDAWHLAQRFTSRPYLSTDWISANTPMERVLAVGPDANGAHVIFDSMFKVRMVRPIPMYSVPGMVDHF